MEAVKGVNKEMSARMRVSCDRCNGSRAEPGSSLSKCSSCNGSGEVTLFYECKNFHGKPLEHSSFCTCTMY